MTQIRIPARLAPLLVSALVSAIKVALVSAVVLVSTQGIHAGFGAQWLKVCATTWPIAFAAAILVAPWIRRLIGRLTV